jgi:hypothetical protein
MSNESFIRICKIWFDVDIVELSIQVSDGQSQFRNRVYVGHEHLENVVNSLESFKSQIHGGIYDIGFGKFGPEYANGAFLARLHYQRSGKINISVHAESEYEEFSDNKVASMVRLYLRSEPALLDTFITQLRAVSRSNDNEAFLECIGTGRHINSKGF